MSLKNIKISLIGGSNVGKLSLVTKYFNIEFFEKSSVGVDQLDGKYKLKDGKEVKITFHINHDGGRLPSNMNKSIDFADGAILVFDLTNPATFEVIKSYMDAVNKEKKNLAKFVFALFGNKCDLERKVGAKDIKQLEETCSLKYFEGSAAKNVMVKEVVDYMVETIYAKNQ